MWKVVQTKDFYPCLEGPLDELGGRIKIAGGSRNQEHVGHCTRQTKRKEREGDVQEALNTIQELGGSHGAGEAGATS